MIILGRQAKGLERIKLLCVEKLRIFALPSISAKVRGKHLEFRAIFVGLEQNLFVKG